MSLTLDAPERVYVPSGRDSAAGEHPATARFRIVVQQRQRLFREGIGQLLAAEEDVDVVATVRTDDDLVQACQEHGPNVAMIEADVSDWDPLRLTATLRRVVSKVAVIGLTASPVTGQDVARARRAGMNTLVSRDLGISGILVALRAPTSPPARERRAGGTLPASSGAPTTSLTSRELEVLSLVGAGLTSNAVSSRLSISYKTVENHKQRIFAKLGVQNQAHAISVAMRTGLLRPERVIHLAAGD